MSCDCRTGATCADHLAERDLRLQHVPMGGQTYPNEASHRELERLLRCAFADCMIALEELGHSDVAARLRERWPEAQAS